MMEACWMTLPFVTWRRSFGTETRRLAVQGMSSSRNNGAEFLEAVE